MEEEGKQDWKSSRKDERDDNDEKEKKKPEEIWLTKDKTEKKKNTRTSKNINTENN